MSSSGSPFDWNSFLMNFGMGMVGQPSLAQSIGAGAQNTIQNLQYQHMLQNMFNPGSPNPVQITPRQTGPTPAPQPQQNQMPAFSGGGLLAGADPRLTSLLGSMTASQGSPIVSSLLQNAITPHPITHTTLPDGQIQDYDWRGNPIGAPHGPYVRKAGEQIYADPNAPNGSATGGVPTAPGLLLQTPAGSSAGGQNLANNNPGNLRPPGAKTGFQSFPTMQDGIAAVSHQLALYGSRGNNTIKGIVSTYAPPTENDTNAYIADVSAKMGVAPTTPLDLKNPQTLAQLTNAMIQHEQGGKPVRLAQNEAAPQPATDAGGMKPMFPPEIRPMTPDELKNYNALPGSTINTVTGAPERATAYNSPAAMDTNTLDGLAASYNLTGKLPTGMGRGGYAAQQVLNRANALVPPEVQQAGPAAIAQWRATNAQNYVAGQRSITNFDQGKLGNQVRAFNVGLMHLDTLAKLSGALQNGDVQAINALSNTFKSQFGRSAPTNFNAARDIVANEIVKAIVGSGGGVGDRDKAQATVNAAQSPQQLAGVIDTYKQLMAGQLKGLATQYQAATGRNDFAQKYLDKEAQGLLSGANPSATAAPAQIKGQADYLKLPSGAHFIGPDGKERIKP